MMPLLTFDDTAEKLDYQPGVFTVERHGRGKRVCNQCETLVQAGPTAIPHAIRETPTQASLHIPEKRLLKVMTCLRNGIRSRRQWKEFIAKGPHTTRERPIPTPV
ncbi:MAG: transposase [Burkholderia sp.]|nr:transposase [Burkholderia sp.]